MSLHHDSPVLGYPTGMAAAGRTYPVSEVRGDVQEELPRIRGQRRRPRGAIPHPRPGGGREDQPHVQGVVAAWVQEGLEELCHVKVRRGGGEEIPLVQGKRNPSRMVGVVRGHQRADTLKP